MLSAEYIGAVVSSELPAGCEVAHVDPHGDRLDFLTAAIMRAQLDVDTALKVYRVTGGPLRSWSILRFGAIVINVGQTGVTAAVCSVMDAGSPARLDLRRVGTGLCLYLLADLAADRGFEAVSRRLRGAAGAVGADALVGLATSPLAQRRGVPEQRLVSSAFGGLHEVGHILCAENPSHQVLSVGDIEARIRSATLDHVDLRSDNALQPRHLHDELRADATCVRWLWSTAQTVLPLVTGEQVGPVEFVLAVAATFCGFATVNLCQQVAADCMSVESADDRARADRTQFALRVAYQVRLAFAVDVAMEVALADLGSDGVAVDGVRLALDELQTRFDEFLHGFDRARAEAYGALPEPSGRAMAPHLWRRGVEAVRTRRGRGS